MVKSITKNRIDHNGEIGIRAMASGYATNARPGPETGKKNTKFQNNLCNLQERWNIFNFHADHAGKGEENTKAKRKPKTARNLLLLPEV